MLLLVISNNSFAFLTLEDDSTKSDTITNDDLIYPIRDSRNDPASNTYYNPFDLKDPSNIEKNIEYDPETKQYIITEKLGKDFYKNPYFISFDDYLKYQAEKSKKDYWQKRTKATSMLERKSLLPKLQVESEVFDRIFGGSTVDIRPQGSAELIFSGDFHRIDNPALSDRLKKTGGFKFDENIQMNLMGQVGEKLRITTNYNTKANFDFENQMRLEYTGYEDEIIQKIEAGNVGLPLKGTLITGSQSLFGIKTQLRFGRLTVTNVLSQQKSETETIKVEAGAQITDFEMTADEYEANKHYFLNQYFRNNYNEALSKLPTIASQVNITKIEIWVTNTQFENEQTTRDIAAFMDLGENSPYASVFTGSSKQFPDNTSNDLMTLLNANPDSRYTQDVNDVLAGFDPGNFSAGLDFVKLENARKLKEREFKFHPKLGYISLNFALNSDEVLAVAYEFTANGNPYKVGEFAADVLPDPDRDKVLFVKLLKSPITRTDIPLWELMMKNIYAMGAYNLQRDNFKLDVIYEDDISGADMPFIPLPKLNTIPLIQLFNLDNLNTQNDPNPDGIFDFVEGITINTSNGRIIFPVIEPFGSDLRAQFKKNGLKDEKADDYAYDALYDSTKYSAQQQAEFNKFKMVGTYQSTNSSEISLGAMNIPKGSVTVLAGGRKLDEGQDYTIDYLLGRVTITNDQILNSGQPIQIKFDNNLYFSVKQKSLLASRFDYQISENFNVGGTALKLTERPLTEKVNTGDEPISNLIWGLDGNYQTESRFLTHLVDKLPFIDTKAPSSINVSGEFAQLKPGHSKFIELDKEPTAYIDDFEASESPIDMKQPFPWVIASTPRLFPESGLTNDLQYGFNRARLSWYYIDPIFYRSNLSTPKHIKDDVTQLSNHYVREVIESDIWPNKQAPSGQTIAVPVLNMVYYPKEKGPYNYDVDGTKDDGSLKNPEQRWGGIMRDLITNDFEAANVEFIEFWLMDPFVYDSTGSGGDLYFNLGNISEDVLKDSRKLFENGLPKNTADTSSIQTTNWGRIPKGKVITNSFDTDLGARKAQDVGFDGLGDDLEVKSFATYLEDIKALHGASSIAHTKAQSDPSTDNYHYFRGNDYDDVEKNILSRYKMYNGLEGNSPTAEQSKEEQGVDYPTAATNRPDGEDINKDNTLSEIEGYFQYKVQIKPSQMEVGKNFITSFIEEDVTTINGQKHKVKWYQFKIPVRKPDEIVGNIQDFKSIRFVRMFLTNFRDSVVLRFAKLQFLRSEWRKYVSELSDPGELISDDDFGGTKFDVSTVDIEENGSKEPVNYVLPPGFDRLKDYLDPALRELNEQSLSMSICNLHDGDSKAIYKNLRLDLRTYKNIKMFIHGEGEDLRDGDLTVFVRLGTDFTSNYYEYEIPLKITPPGSYFNDDESDRKIVWPAENHLELPLEILRQVKLARDVAV
ncbi:MAG: cell surface protein SprA, partial [Bacteroidia bacterium]|nr:cell surface protein SprA [Bacteroidia bacterium]